MPRFTVSRREYDAVVFGLGDAVVSAGKLHAEAWKSVLDEYRKRRAGRDIRGFPSFDTKEDYRRQMHAKPLYEGVKSFLDSRGIRLPYGKRDDPPKKETICGLGNHKDKLFLKRLEREGVELNESSVELLHHLRSVGFKIAVVTPSKNCTDVLRVAEIAGLFDVKVDGRDAIRLGLKGKPAPNALLEASRQMGAEPERTVIIDESATGVKAGHLGRFGRVVGVDMAGEADTLKKSGADVIVSNLGEIAVRGNPVSKDRITKDLPCALACVEEIIRRAQVKRVAVFLDYDGTLTPAVDPPDEAKLSAEMRTTLWWLAKHLPVIVISGRDLSDLLSLVAIEEIVYAGSHGLDITGPHSLRQEDRLAGGCNRHLQRAEKVLRNRLGAIDGVRIERKRFNIAIHYSEARDTKKGVIKRVVDEVVAENSGLRTAEGRGVVGVLPDIDWNKGMGLTQLMRVLNLDRPDVLPIYVGDGLTDECAFEALRERGIGIVVRREPRQTAAEYALDSEEDVRLFLEALVFMLTLET